MTEARGRCASFFPFLCGGLEKFFAIESDEYEYKLVFYFSFYEI